MTNIILCGGVVKFHEKPDLDITIKYIDENIALNTKILLKLRNVYV